MYFFRQEINLAFSSNISRITTVIFINTYNFQNDLPTSLQLDYHLNTKKEIISLELYSTKHIPNRKLKLCTYS